MAIMFTCDLCGDDNNDNNQFIYGHIYGIMGERSTPDASKLKINFNPTIDDDFHICHMCLKSLSDSFVNMNK